MNEIDVVIHELESMREMLRRKAERVSVDLAEFASVKSFIHVCDENHFAKSEEFEERR